MANLKIKKPEQIMVRVDVETRELFEKLCIEDHRSAGNLIEKLIHDEARRKGLIKTKN